MTTDLLELVDKHLSAIAGVTVRDMPVQNNLGLTQGRADNCDGVTVPGP